MFNGRRTVQVGIGIIALYLISAIAISNFGRTLARNHETVLNIFSHQSGLFGWSYEFTDGNVGPFTIGENIEELRASMRDVSGIKVVLPRSNNELDSDGFVDVDDIPDKATEIYTLVPCGSSQCSYNFTLKNGAVSKIWKGHALLSGL